MTGTQSNENILHGTDQFAGRAYDAIVNNVIRNISKISLSIEVAESELLSHSKACVSGSELTQNTVQKFVNQVWENGQQVSFGDQYVATDTLMSITSMIKEEVAAMNNKVKLPEHYRFNIKTIQSIAYLYLSQKAQAVTSQCLAVKH